MLSKLLKTYLLIKKEIVFIFYLVHQQKME